MSNISKRHTSDAASTFIFDPTNSVFDNSDTNLQLALDSINENAVKPYPNYQYATENTLGIITTATLQEVESLNSGTKYIQVKDLLTFFSDFQHASETDHGSIEIATTNDITTGTDDSKAITISKIDTQLTDNIVSTENDNGILLVSTQAQAENGSDDSTMMTPKKTALAIIEQAPILKVYATTNRKGIVRLANDNEVNGVRNDVVFTPYSIGLRNATTKNRGLLYLGSTLTDSDQYAITPGNISDLTATDNKHGFVKLYDGLDSTATDSTITANQGKIMDQDLIGSSGGTINPSSDLILYDSYSNSKEYKKIPVGSSYYTKTISVKRSFISSDPIHPNIGKVGRPVGSIYLNADPNFNPNNYFYGDWELYSNGRALVGSGSTEDNNSNWETFVEGKSGGEYEVSTTLENEPRHQHVISWGENRGRGPFRDSTTVYKYGRGYIGGKHTDFDNYYYYTNYGDGSDDASHNNIAAYSAVNIWRRIR